MKVLYEKPDNIMYNRWFDDTGSFDIWYLKTTTIPSNFNNLDIPDELKEFLNKWCLKIEEYKKNYIELYPVKLAHIEFIYKDVIYNIEPETINATYKSSFMSDEEYDVSWDSLFEKYEKEIRDDLKKSLGVIHSRYYGFLD